VSRTGNLLFPESEDDGWVSSILKALPEPKKDGGPNDTSGEAIEDPVAIEAEARFSELAAETAEREAISAAGWSATTTTPKGPPPTVEDGLSPAALDALDAVIDREALNARDFKAVEDPVSLEAASAFAETAADTATRDAVQTAGWTAEVRRPDGLSRELPQKQQPEAPGPVAPGTDPAFSPEALAALDSVLSRYDVRSVLEATVTDPVALEADAAFAEVAAEVVTGHAIFAAGWSAMARKPGDGGGCGADTGRKTGAGRGAGRGSQDSRFPDPYRRPGRAGERRRVFGNRRRCGGPGRHPDRRMDAAAHTQ